MQLLHLAVALLLAIGVFVAVRVVRLLYLSPLGRIPGPKLYAFTDWFYLYYLLRGEWPAKLKTLHDKYGPTLRYSPDDISSIEPETWKTVYGHKTHSDRNFEKDPLFLSPPPNGANSVLRADNDDHRRMRRVLAHAFSEKALRGQEDIINTYIDLFISRLAEKAAAKESIDIMRWFNLTTFDLIGDLAFGKPFGCLESGTYNPWVNMLFDTARFGTIGQAFRRYPLLGSLKSWLIPAKLGRSFAEHVQLSERTAMERIERGNVGRDDFMDYILRHNDEKGLSKAEIVSNASLLIIAGSETTATLLSGTTFHLLTNRDKYNKLVGEIRERFSSEDEINMSSVNDLPYLLAVLQEGFRMYPPVPIGLARVAPSGGETVNGFYLPENTKISVAQWSAYQSEHNWTDPIRFVPERWLDVDTRYENDKRDVLQPFSVGPRNCIGKNLAYAEMRVILTRLLWRFDLEILPESHNWMDQRIFFLWDKPALMVKITPAHKL